MSYQEDARGPPAGASHRAVPRDLFGAGRSSGELACTANPVGNGEGRQWGFVRIRTRPHNRGGRQAVRGGSCPPRGAGGLAFVATARHSPGMIHQTGRGGVPTRSKRVAMRTPAPQLLHCFQYLRSCPLRPWWIPRRCPLLIARPHLIILIQKGGPRRRLTTRLRFNLVGSQNMFGAAGLPPPWRFRTMTVIRRHLDELSTLPCNPYQTKIYSEADGL